ncbi:hypothetical protein MNEG_8382 [Monoraphidium neglectum]|uniref:Uncharacterized protein n=1 Tax=Monoraphidium neglectum TaxID=145388 RepID=A0A0D2KW63_9CHLO|nr:hypothetical protein MNEG_8382 [Monoraphidium neglectum]KIY99578.1 hypothetical protein MNEG_8382 [Monoraphidium neglectum]|eukprot:XP_013898598.1 hypothetical protein MNEG_8382 [Monoraphidium neglectum]
MFPDASDERVQLPPPLERQEELAAARVAGLASLRAQNPRMGEAALLSYWREGERRAGRLPHDGVRAGSYAPPDFLSGYPVPNGFSFNYNSFMGQMDPLDGKYYVAPQLLSSFLREVHGAMGRRWAKLCLSENYNKRAYRHFQELDFDWSMPIEAVLAAVPRIAAIVAEEAARAHGLEGPPPAPIVHLNFPGIVTTEGRARRARKAVINRCRAELAGLPPLALLRDEIGSQQALQRAEAELRSLRAEEARLRALAAGLGGGGGGSGGAGDVVTGGDEAAEGSDGGGAAAGEQGGGPGGGAGLEGGGADISNSSSSSGSGSGSEVGDGGGGGGDPQGGDPLLASLDWEAVVDVPHGSLRLPGCYKAPWMDKDPDWVLDKCYSVVEWRPDEGGDRGGGAWYKVPLTLELLRDCSIHPPPEQVAEYEQSAAFMEDSFQDIERKRTTNAVRNSVKQARKAIKALCKELGLEPPQQHQPQPQQQQQQQEGSGGAGAPQAAQQQKERVLTLAEAAAAALEEQARRAEERRRREAEMAEKKRRAEELMRAASSRLAGAARPSPASPAKPQLRGPPALRLPPRAQPPPPPPPPHQQVQQ